MDLSFYSYLTFATLTGTFFGMYLLFCISGVTVRRKKTLVGLFSVLNIPVAAALFYTRPRLQLSISFHVILLLATLIYLWFWSSSGNIRRTAWKLWLLFAVNTVLLWSCWLLMADKAEGKILILPALTGFVLAFVLIIVPLKEQFLLHTGYLLSVLQGAFVLYFLLEPRWSEPFSPVPTPAGSPEPVVFPGLGIVLASTLILVFLFGILSKKFIKKKKL